MERLANWPNDSLTLYAFSGLVCYSLVLMDILQRQICSVFHNCSKKMLKIIEVSQYASCSSYCIALTLNYRHLEDIAIYQI